MNRLNFQCAHRFASGFSLEVVFQTSAQVTALFGPSGSGKTSVLYAIAGLLRPQAGSIAWGQTAWFDSRRRDNVPADQRHVGFVFQDQLLFPHLNVRQNLEYGRRRRSDRATAIEPARVIEVLELAEFMDRYPRNLSGGERQRVALGRALLSGPELLLMDEPLAALDEALKDRVLSYIQRVLAEWRLPLVYVSHNAAEVRRLAEQVVVLEQGRVRETGTPEDVLTANYSLF